jgi:multidrug efflux system membrane fusion protein
MDRNKHDGQTVTEMPRAPQSRPSISAPEHQSSYGWLWVLLVLGMLGGGGYYYYTHVYANGAGAATKQSGPPSREVPVVTATAKKGDMQIFLDGLGSVSALNTVTLHTRVDGQLDKVNFVEGQLVHKDDVLAEIDPRPFQVQLTQAEGQLARDQAQYENAVLDLKKFMAAGTSVSQQERDTAKAAVNQFAGAVKSDQGQIDSAKLQLAYCRITAPLTGRIGLRLMDQGNIVHASDANGLAVIVQLQPIAVIFNLAQDDIPQVQTAMRAVGKLEVQAWDRDRKNKLATGALEALDSQVDPTSGTVRLKAIFPNEQNELFPLQFVNARLLVETLHDTILVPTAAVQRSPTSTFAYVVKPDNTVEMKTIVLGPTEGNKTAIESGLNPGDVVVTDGVDKLVQGTKVTKTKLNKPGAETKPATSATTNTTKVTKE